jgi:hypothetical protein
MIAFNETNLMYYLSLFSEYNSTCFGLPSSLCDNWYNVLYVLVDRRRARRNSTKTFNTYQLSHIYIVTLNDGLQMGPKHVEEW